MRRRRLGVSLLLLGILVVALGWWLLVRTPPPTATIGYFGENKFLCVRPGQLVGLRFSKPLPSGIEEWRKHLKQIGVSEEAFQHPPETVAWYWFDIEGVSEGGKWWLISEKEIVFEVQRMYGIFPVKYPSPDYPSTQNKSGGKFEFMLFILGDRDLDRIIERQEALPPDGRIPSKGTVEVYYVEPSLWVRMRCWLRHELRQRGIFIRL